MGEFIVVGSLNMDLVANVVSLPALGQTITATSFQAIPGGKGANQAATLSRLGARVKMVGRVGQDAYGQTLRINLEKHNVDCTYVRMDPQAPTGIALITVDAQGDNTIVVVPGANGACTVQDIQQAAAIFAEAQALLVQLEVPLATVEAALTQARQNGVTTILNPAPVCQLSRELLAKVDVLIPNETEAAFLCGYAVADVATAIRAAQDLCALGPKRTIITLGAKGAVFAGPEGEFHIPAYKIQEVDATAAGDAFIAAFTVAWLEGKDIAASIRYACAAGALTASRAGAQISLPTRDEVAAFMR